MRWQYIDSPTHDRAPFDDDTLTFGHVWNAGAAHNGLRPLYLATNEHVVIDNVPVYAIRFYWMSVEALRELTSVEAHQDLGS